MAPDFPLILVMTTPRHFLTPLQEISDLRKTLNTEVEALRGEFLELRSVLKQQLDATAALVAPVRALWNKLALVLHTAWTSS